MELLLDTSALIHLATEEPIPKNVQDTLLTSNILLMSSISGWEIFMLEKMGRITLNAPPPEWFVRTTELLKIQIVNIDLKIARRSAYLDWFHRDPADRIIVATALEYRACLLTNDRVILRSNLVECVEYA